MSEMSRRDFAEAIALAGLVPLLGVAPGSVRHAALDPALAVEDLSSLARALAGVVRAQYADRLSEADLATIARQIEASLERAAKVRKVALANGDEPDFVFSAVRAGALG
jgi:signal transduction histidine kinase